MLLHSHSLYLIANHRYIKKDKETLHFKENSEGSENLLSNSIAYHNFRDDIRHEVPEPETKDSDSHNSV
jgi:hypothetical protein